MMSRIDEEYYKAVWELRKLYETIVKGHELRIRCKPIMERTESMSYRSMKAE